MRNRKYHMNWVCRAAGLSAVLVLAACNGGGGGGGNSASYSGSQATHSQTQPQRKSGKRESGSGPAPIQNSPGASNSQPADKDTARKSPVWKNQPQRQTQSQRKSGKHESRSRAAPIQNSPGASNSQPADKDTARKSPARNAPARKNENKIPVRQTLIREKAFWKNTLKYAKEYMKSGIFSRTNARNGLPRGKVGGDGVVIGIIDTGIDFNHPELKGAEAGKNPNPDTTDRFHGTAVAGVVAAKRDGYGMHGVAPFAKLLDLSVKPKTNRKDADCPKYETCFKPSARMLLAAAGLDPDQLDPKDRTKHRKIVPGSKHKYAWAKADIVNMSFRVFDTSGYWIKPMQEAAANGVLMTVALGNWERRKKHKDRAWEEPLAPASHVAEDGIRGYAIAVGNLDKPNGRLVWANEKDFKSHHCGEKIKYFCIFAPGMNVYSTKHRKTYQKKNTKNYKYNYEYFKGTSFAAPVVAGYLANLMSAFPSRKGQKWGHDGVYKNANWYVARLLSTAKDLGDKGVDKIYGVGAVDGTAALTPQGTTSAVTSSGHFTMAQTQAIGDMRLGTGMANLGQAAALNQVLVYDEHRAPFLMNLQGRVERTQPSSSSYIADFVKRLSALDDEPAIAKQPIVAGMDMAFGFTLSQHQGLGKAYDTASLFDTAETPIALAATSDPLAFSMGTRTAMGAAVSLSDTMTLSFSASSNRKPDESPDPSDTTFLLTQDEADAHRAKLLGRLGLNYEGEYGAFQLQSGILHEKKGLFDTTGSDALAFARDARASYVQLGARIPLTDRIDLLGSYTQGWAAVDEAGESMWRGHEDMRFNAFTLGASYKGLFDTTDKLSFTVGQPLRLTSGSVYLRKAPGERNGAAYLVDAPVDLSPEDRELMFQLAYQVDIARRARLSLGGYYRINPGHDKRQPDDFGIGAKFSMRF